MVWTVIKLQRLDSLVNGFDSIIRFTYSVPEPGFCAMMIVVLVAGSRFRSRR